VLPPLYGVDLKQSMYFRRPKVQAAVQFAAAAHMQQQRMTGEPYVAHCIETALIVELNLPTSTHDDRCAAARHSSVAKFGRNATPFQYLAVNLGAIPVLRPQNKEPCWPRAPPNASFLVTPMLLYLMPDIYVLARSTAVLLYCPPLLLAPSIMRAPVARPRRWLGAAHAEWS
jgi:hypothetical protein